MTDHLGAVIQIYAVTLIEVWLPVQAMLERDGVDLRATSYGHPEQERAAQRAFESRALFVLATGN